MRLILAAALGYSFLAGAALSALGLSVSTGGGALIGVAHEYVYDQRVAPNYKVSELDWSFEPIYYYGVNVILHSPDRLSLLLSAKSGISGPAGIMQDSDFLNGNGVKTLFSESNNYVEQALLARARVDYRIPLPAGFSVSPFLLIDYLHMKWSAHDGYLQYPPATGQSYTVNSNGTVQYGTTPVWSSALPKTPIYGVSVIYGQQYVIPAIGLAAAYRPSSRLAVELDLAYSPVVIARATDDHVLRSLSTVDTYTQGTYLEPAVDLAYAMSDHFSIRFDASYRIITGLVGSTTWQNDGTTNTSPATQFFTGPAFASTVLKGAGASLQALDVGLSLQVTP